MTLRVKVTSPEDVLITLTITDVRCMPGTSSSVCNSANSADGPDYSGELQGNATIRISFSSHSCRRCMIAARD